MLKTTLLPIILLCCLFRLPAQDNSNVKLAIEAGILPVADSENLGLLLNVEPKLKVSGNIFIGLRVGMVINPQSIENYNVFQFRIGEEFDNGGISLVPTFDYYLKGENYRPYLGFGLGPYLLTKYVDVFEYVSQERIEVTVKDQVGFLLRGGVEANRFRYGLEYNFIFKAEVEMPDGQIIGAIDNSYLGLSIGYVIGGGKRA